MRISFEVPAVPVAQPRQRHRVVTPKGGKPFATNYTPRNHEVQTFKSACIFAAQRVYDGAPLDGPLHCDMVFVLPRPTTRPKWIVRGSYWMTEWKEGRRVPHIGKPDRDNLMKSIQDAWNQTLFRDDSLLWSGDVAKWIATTDEQPHVEITIETMEE